MTTVLENTDAYRIAAALVDARRSAGSPAMGMVLTLVVVVPEDVADDALAAAAEASHEHPSRRLGIVIGATRGASRIDAEIRTGAGAPGEDALIRLTGEVARHPESVVLPLLLPDSPVVVWWPTDAPADPAHDPLGALGNRRITDAAEVPTRRAKAMLTQCQSYAPGNTDLAWTRITGWRALLAAALDQVGTRVTGVEIAAQRISPSADLLGAWLADRLRAPVTRKRFDGVGIHEVVLTTKGGAIRISREDDRSGILELPGRPEQPVALRRRTLPELLAEELRRLDPDDVYAATVRRLSRMDGGSPGALGTATGTTKPNPKAKATEPAKPGKPGKTRKSAAAAGAASGTAAAGTAGTAETEATPETEPTETEPGAAPPKAARAPKGGKSRKTAKARKASPQAAPPVEATT